MFCQKWRLKIKRPRAWNMSDCGNRLFFSPWLIANWTESWPVDRRRETHKAPDNTHDGPLLADVQAQLSALRVALGSVCTRDPCTIPGQSGTKCAQDPVELTRQARLPFTVHHQQGYFSDSLPSGVSAFESLSSVAVLCLLFRLPHFTACFDLRSF